MVGTEQEEVGLGNRSRNCTRGRFRSLLPAFDGVTSMSAIGQLPARVRCDRTSDTSDPLVRSHETLHDLGNERRSGRAEADPTRRGTRFGGSRVEIKLLPLRHARDSTTLGDTDETAADVADPTIEGASSDLSREQDKYTWTALMLPAWTGV
jgi:hypothetical protein